ncbi:hypothetical protein BGX34_010786 [Mortierella sp. NVP85]|nr:hypothetical protein BGX34_010786 [Mortierella sp. NVP85]
MASSRPLLSPAPREDSHNTGLPSNQYGTMDTHTTKETDVPIPEASASYISKVFISWMTPIFKIGYRRHLQEQDISEMIPEHRTKALSIRLQECWDEELRNASTEGGHRQPSLTRAICRFVPPYFWFGQVCLVISDNISRITPFVVLWIIDFVGNTQNGTAPLPSIWYGYGLAALLFATCMIQSITGHIWTIANVVTGALLRAALIDLIFQKSTTISSKARLDYPDGTVFNLMATDTSRIDLAVDGLMLVVVVPIGCLITVGLLTYLMGPSALLGTFVLIMSNPLQAWAMTALNPIRERALKFTDTRIRVMTEILQGIKVIKFFTFEPSFLKKVSSIRDSELHGLAILMQVRGIIYSISSSLPIFASALSFVLYAALGNKLEARIIFPALTLFTALRVPLLVLPYCYSEALDAWVSIKRIERYLVSLNTEPLPPVDTTYDYALSFRNATFYWDRLPSNSVSETPSSLPSSTSKHTTNGDTVVQDDEQPLLGRSHDRESDSETMPFLKDISIDIPRGSLVAVVGPVGSGKSSLLQAMVGNMMKSQGEVIRGTSISYASQTPWIQNATIRNNILFDTPLNEERYWRVVKACSLEQDLSSMPYGDQTEIGERGVNLSGGQKARLSLARSVYYDAQTVIMDDPLSAVDAHVGKRLWQDCILQELGKKTRIIATHQLHVLPDVDYVICMKHGRVTEQGTYQDLMAQEGEFYTLMKQYGGHHHGSAPRRALKRNISSSGKVLQVVDVASDDDTTVSSTEDEETQEAEVFQGQMSEEERAYGAVPSQVYRAYFRLGGTFNWTVIVFLMVLQQVAGVLMSVWLGYWTEDRFKLPLWTYIHIYLGTGMCQLVIVLIGSFMLVVAVIKSSGAMHNRAFISVLRSPMSFFDTTPVGRILNRFSKDINTIDTTLMDAINAFMITVTGILGVLVLSSISLPWMIPAMILLSVVYILMAVFYQRTSRELKRIDAVLRSHLFSYFSETLAGMATLRAYHPHGIQTAIAKNQQNMDRSNKAYYHLIMGMRWMAVRAHTLGNVLILAAAVLIVYGRFGISPAAVGLVLSYLARLSSEMNWVIQCFARVENNMNSVERLLYYADELPQEPPAEILDCKPSPTWPSQGQISFQNVSVRYRPGLPLVLKNISFEIPAGYRVGVVGRTGAGKSSLIQTLFLLVDLDTGKVVMDGIETGSIGTADLRSKIAIIPQDPVVFQGTVRYNLDPLGRHTDQELWQALETSDMRSYVQQQEGGLEAPISAQGENLSVGQRQLICLSRALLAKSKVVVLDEATASVDLATDSLIQKAIREDFAGSTVITIAHRLNTVIDYDRILLMEHGEVAEYDTPRALLSDPNSAFSKMVDETGAANAALLRSLAGCD